MPRKRSDEFYRLHGFTANYNCGKYSATCNFCDRELQNTALSRLSLHRQVCDQRRNQVTKAPIIGENDIENRQHFKILEYSGEDDDGTKGKEIIVKIQEIIDSADDENADQSRIPVLVRSETRKSAYPDQEPEQHLLFEISSIDDSKEQQQGKSATGLEPLIEARPRNNLLALKAKKVRAEIKQYHSKTQFFRTETENLKAERTLTLLRIQKLRLEIDIMRA